MNTTKLVICTLVGTVFMFLLDYLFYGMLVGPAPDPDAAMPNFLIMGLGYAIMALFFCLIYARWCGDGSATSEGMRFGVMAAFLIVVGTSILFHGLSASGTMFQEWSNLGNVLRDSVFEVVKFAVLGIIVAHLSGLHSGDRGKDERDQDPLPPPPPPEDDGGEG